MHLPDLIFYPPQTKPVPIADLDMIDNALKLIPQANALVITNGDSCAEGTTLGRQLSATLATLEDTRLDATRPYRDATDDINARCKVITGPLKKAIDSLKDRLGEYAAKVEEARQAQELERQRLEREAQQVADGRVTAPLVTSVGMPIQPAAIHTRRDIEVIITDESRIPDKYWVRNDTLIRADILAGATIPGVTHKELRKVVNR